MRSSRQALASWHPAIEDAGVFDEAEGRIESAPSSAWRALYMAALFETDEERFVKRIAEARRALALRAHELFRSAEDHFQERSAIEATLQSLHALERCRVVRPMVLSSEIEGAIASIETACAD
ncbi:MAG TPA: hypothetical protein VMI10_03360 [Terriglobales bacterium]|nr:hypothetical protein [Terriglobales bacterium]